MILLLADIHLKLGAKNIPKEWALNRYRLFFEQVFALQSKLTSVVIPGDTFDKTPSVEELALFFEFIKGFTVPCYISTGNHESITKKLSFLTHLKETVQYINPLVQIVDTPTQIGGYTILPYEFISKKENWDNITTTVVFSHLRGEIPPHVKPEIPLEWLARFDVVYAGDLHSHSNCQKNIVYPGSPLTTSFHRNEVETGYILIDENDLTKWSWHSFKLPQLIRKTVSDPSEMIETEYHRTIYELEGSIVDLGGVRNTELLDKKLVKRSTETTLILDNGMSMADEMVEYYRYVLELSEAQIKEIMATYHDYAKST